jgi:hypothetical protein
MRVPGLVITTTLLIGSALSGRLTAVAVADSVDDLTFSILEMASKLPASSLFHSPASLDNMQTMWSGLIQHVLKTTRDTEASPKFEHTDKENEGIIQNAAERLQNAVAVLSSVLSTTEVFDATREDNHIASVWFSICRFHKEMDALMEALRGKSHGKLKDRMKHLKHSVGDHLADVGDIYLVAASGLGVVTV